MKEISDGSLEIMATKGLDYATNGGTHGPRVLTDVVELADTNGVSPATVLRIYLQKHLTAIQRAAAGSELKSEALLSRVQDAQNYLAMIYITIKHDEEIRRA